MTATVLLVEDERKLRELVRSYLERAGFMVLSTGSGAEAISLAGSAGPDLVILDLRLPDVPGETVAREIRAAGTTPILMLTAKSAEDDRIAGLELGADDYVTKPFSIEELVERVRAVLRRSTGSTPGEHRLSYADLELDEETRDVWRAGQLVELTPTEFKLLHYLLLNARRVLTREQILEHVWDYTFAGNASVLETYVSYLRHKIDTVDPPLIHTIRGVGYSLRLPRDQGG
jgi:two-component system OmpR family response regulator